MAITRVWSTLLGPTLVRVHFESDLDVPVGLSQVAQVDVFDDDAAVPAAVYPAGVTLVWDVLSDVAASRIEEWSGSAWEVRATIPATGSGLARWESPPLEDGAEYLFRAVPVDGTGRDGVAREFSGVMCRWPDAPTGSVSVSGGEFLIEA
jgi:hypothetical protein